jgi:hypothetical protein
MLTSGGRPLIQIAAELGIAPSMLRNWQSGGRRKSPGFAARNDRLRMERDILKNYVGPDIRLWRLKRWALWLGIQPLMTASPRSWAELSEIAADLVDRVPTTVLSLGDRNSA